MFRCVCMIKGQHAQHTHTLRLRISACVLIKKIYSRKWAKWRVSDYIFKQTGILVSLPSSKLHSNLWPGANSMAFTRCLPHALINSTRPTTPNAMRGQANKPNGNNGSKLMPTTSSWYFAGGPFSYHECRVCVGLCCAVLWCVCARFVGLKMIFEQEKRSYLNSGIKVQLHFIYILHFGMLITSN